MQGGHMKALVILIHAFVGWGLCGAIIGIGRKMTSMQTTLIIHAIGVPIIFGIISFVYFKKFHYTTEFQTAVIFLLFVVIMDFFLVAMVIEKNFAMFASILGSWIPFALIFLSTYVMGRILSKK
jgi:hypothetical protein